MSVREIAMLVLLFLTSAVEGIEQKFGFVGLMVILGVIFLILLLGEVKDDVKRK